MADEREEEQTMDAKPRYQSVETETAAELTAWLNARADEGYRLVSSLSRAIRGGDGWLVAVVELQ